jgi:putative redox protein
MAERLEVSATWRGGWATDVRARGHALRVDEPESAGGRDGGPMPTEVFLASLASCFCLAVGFAARKQGLQLVDLAVNVSAERAGRELRYERLAVVTTALADDATLAGLVEQARRYCWVSNTLAAGVAVEYSHTPR